jgi:hypothetical protein
MKTLKIPLLVFVAILLIFPAMIGCGFVEDMKELFREMNASAAEVKAKIETEIGGEVEIGWEIENETTTVNIVFLKLPADSVNLKQLRQEVIKIVHKHFDREIQYINISF